MAPGSFDLERLPHTECMSKFRLSKTDIYRLVHCFSIPDVVQTAERTSCTAVEALCIVLRRLAVPDRWEDLIAIFHRSPSGLSNIFLHMIEFLVSKFDDILYLDRERVTKSLAVFSEAIHAKGR